MKVTNWRRKLMASLVAGGLIAPAATQAADLDTNLVANPGFENVSFATIGDYGAPMILDWSGGPGFAYSHNPGVTGVPDYADGADPPGAGNWYFTANNNPGSATGDFRAPNLVYQDINLSAGATGTQIASGEAAYRLSAWMSSYLNDNDSGNVQVDFKNSGGTTIGTAIISDPDFGPNNVWSLTSMIGLVPAGTASMRVSIYGTPRNSGADGYIDNVDVQLTAAANELLFLEVNTTTGLVAIKNQTGDAVHIDYYEIRSNNGSGNSLTVTGWNSFQDPGGNPSGFPSGNGTGNGWEEAGGSNSGILSESYLTGSSAVPHSTTSSISLGAAFRPGFTQNLTFFYGALAAPASIAGDFNGDSRVDAADYVVWRKTINTPQAYSDWRTNFGNVAASTGPSTLIQGFVRYVTSGAGSAVPEPSTVLLFGIGLISLVAGTRKPSAD